ncbi:MAG: Npt1/Npt2 family nucleotide transporter [Candidatus Neomarinimicrobiota bacterium]|nr:Npt1/Npt2 family nucleotide transporter [Candidatus Neomarinimicrobiota bacterium]
MALNLINVRRDERTPVLLLFLQFFAIVAISITGSSARDAFFLNLFDRSYLPLMFFAIAITMVIVITVYKWLTDGRDSVQVITAAGLFFASTLYLIQLKLQGWVIPTLFVWMEIIVSLSILQFWMLAGEIFDPRQAKRLFSILGAGGSVAGILAGYSLKPFVKLFGSEKLLYLTIVFIFLSVILANLVKGYRRTADQKKQVRTEPKKRVRGKSKFKFDPYLKSIALFIGLAAFISKIVDYQFKMTAVQTYPLQDELVSFFGTYYMVTGGATLIMQFFVTGVVLARFGILAGLLVLPITLALGSTGFFISPILITVFIAKFSDQVFKFSINNASQEILWLPVPKERKKEAKPVIDSAVRAILEGVVGVIIFLLVQSKLVPVDRLHLLSIIVIFGVVAWIWNSFRLKKGYIKTLMKAIEKRQLDLEDVEFDVTDNHIIQTIEKTLRDEDELKQIFGIDLLKTMPLDPWKETLAELFKNGTPTIRREVLELAGKDSSVLSDESIAEIATGKGDLSPKAIAFAGGRGLKSLESQLVSNLTSDNFELRAASAIALFEMDCHREESKKALLDMLQSSSQEATIAALNYLQEPMGVLSDDLLIQFLKHDHSRIRESALVIARNRGVETLLQPIISNLAFPKTAMQARHALSAYDLEDVFVVLESLLKDGDTDFFFQLGIIRCLRHYGDERSARILSSLLHHDKLLFLSETVDSILGVARKTDLSEEFLTEVSSDLKNLSRSAYQLNLFKAVLPNDENGLLLRDHVDSDIRRTVGILLKLGVLQTPNTPIETYIQYIASKDPELVPFVLEFVDTTFSQDNKKYTLPLIDNEVEISQAADELFSDLVKDFDELLMEWIYSNHQWKTAIALNYFVASGRNDLIEKVEWSRIDESIFVNQLFERIEDSEGHLKEMQPVEKTKNEGGKQMYSILEKTILLKSVDLFKNIPGDVLTRIAQIAEEERPLENSALFKEGDFGNSMYVIVDGNVRIHKGEQHIASLGKGACLGEMALLDQEPRSADATTEEDSTLLKISQDGFYELMSGNSEIMQQIIKLLSGRIRDTNAKLQEIQAGK